MSNKKESIKIDQWTRLKLIGGSIIEIDSKMAVFRLGMNKFGSFVYKVLKQVLKLDHDRHGRVTRLSLYDGTDNKPSLIWGITKDGKFFLIEGISIPNF